MPDQLTDELEFLHVLAVREGLVVADGDDPTPYRLAAADFLERHVLSWLPEAVASVQEHASLPLYTAIVASLVAFAQADAAWLRTLTAEEVDRD